MCIDIVLYIMCIEYRDCICNIYIYIYDMYLLCVYIYICILCLYVYIYILTITPGHAVVYDTVRRAALYPSASVRGWQTGLDKRGSIKMPINPP